MSLFRRRSNPKTAAIIARFASAWKRTPADTSDTLIQIGALVFGEESSVPPETLLGEGIQSGPMVRLANAILVQSIDRGMHRVRIHTSLSRECVVECLDDPKVKREIFRVPSQIGPPLLARLLWMSDILPGATGAVYVGAIRVRHRERNVLVTSRFDLTSKSEQTATLEFAASRTGGSER